MSASETKDETVAEAAHILRVMSEKGDETFRWDPNKPGEVAGARAQWDHYKAKGWVGYTVGDGGRGAVLREFDPAARAIVMAPPVAGGSPP